MDILTLEKKCKKIVDLRTKRQDLQGDINKNVAEVLAHMKSLNKRTLKVGNYTLEISQRTRRKFDWGFLDNLQDKGILPESAMKKETFERLFIVSSLKMRLEGGKFVYD